MKRKTILSIASLAALCLADVAAFNVAQAFNMGNIMNPSRWFRDNDRYYDRGYYGGGPYGYGYGPYGYGGGPYGWGGPYGGWGGYPGYGGYGGYGQQPSTIVVNPSTSGSSNTPAPPPPPRLPE